MPDPEPVPCWWVWNGVAWVPSQPHDCPPYHVCPLPNYEGTLIGQFARELCTEVVGGEPC